MVKQAKKRGFVTFDQLNEVLHEVLPSDTTSPEQIEDIMSMLSDMGINVSEAEDADSEEANKEKAGDETDNELVEVTQKAVIGTKKLEPRERIVAIVPAMNMLGYSNALRMMSRGRTTYI